MATETAPDARRRAEAALAESEQREMRQVECYLPGSIRSDAAKLRQALRDLLAATTQEPEANVCEKCGYVGPLVTHPGCNYQAGHLNPWPPAPAAASEEVREAAERLRHALTPPRNITPDGYIFVRAEDVETILAALASRGASR